MTPTERTVLDAAIILARYVKAYNALVDRPDWSPKSSEYIDAANAMDAAEDALIEAAQLLLPDA